MVRYFLAKGDLFYWAFDKNVEWARQNARDG